MNWRRACGCCSFYCLAVPSLSTAHCMTLVYHLFTLELCTSLWQGAMYVSTHVPMLTPHVASKLLFVIFIKLCTFVCTNGSTAVSPTLPVLSSVLFFGRVLVVQCMSVKAFVSLTVKEDSITEQQLYYECVIVRLSVLVQLEYSQACCCHVYG